MLHVKRRRDAVRLVVRLLCGAIFAAAVAGCANTPKTRGLPWWPQGPGNASEGVPPNVDEPAQAATQAGTVHSLSIPSADIYTEAVRYRDLLFVSGQAAIDPASLTIVGSDIQTQVRVTMDNLVRILASHGLAIGNVLSVTMYMVDIDELPKADAVYASYFRRSPPARSVVSVKGLPKGSLIEIAVIAGR